jgi:hypothetical protein
MSLHRIGRRDAKIEEEDPVMMGIKQRLFDPLPRAPFLVVGGGHLTQRCSRSFVGHRRASSSDQPLAEAERSAVSMSYLNLRRSKCMRLIRMSGIPETNQAVEKIVIRVVGSPK